MVQSTLCQSASEARLVFGSAIHRAAEFHFRELLSGNPAPDLDTLLDCYQQEWRDRDGTLISFPKRDDVDSLGQLAERVLTAFGDSDVADPQGTILGVEEEPRVLRRGDRPRVGGEMWSWVHF